MAYLAISHDNQPAQRVPLDKESLIIGRDADTDVRLESAKVSRRHARVFLQAGCHWIEDLGSINGVALDGHPIGEARKLTPGCAIQVGDFQLTYLMYESPDATTFFLVGLDPPFENEKFVLLPRGELLLGRTPENAVVVPDPSLSRTHARLTITKNSVRIADMQSSNGVYVNGTRITETDLRIGDRVSLGSVHLRLGAAGRSADKARALRIGIIAGVLGSALVLFGALWWQPGLLRDWRLLLGQGRLTAEARDKALQKDLSAAQQFVQERNWEAAAQAYREVLSIDPLNTAARVGIDATLSNVHDNDRLQRAQAALEHNKPDVALSLASDLGSDSPFRDKAHQVQQLAEQKILAERLVQARTACQHADWRSCQALSVRYLAHRQDATEAQALANLAEEGMQQRTIAYVSWHRDTQAWQTTLAALKQTYPDAGVRLLALQYGTGDLDGAAIALQRLFQQPGGAALAEKFTTVGALLDDKAPNQSTDNPLSGAARWENLQRIDTQILPLSFANVYRDRIRARTMQSLIDAGQAAFDRGLYGQAFARWNEVLTRDPTNNSVIGALSRLEGRAKALLDSLPDNAGSGRSAPACQQLQEIIGMTRKDSAVAQKAAAKFKAMCQR